MFSLKSFLVIILAGLFSATAFAEGRCVILLHGLGRSHYSMLSLEKALKAKNYTVINQGYPSTRFAIHDLTNTIIPQTVKECLATGANSIYFVTHSLGGILVRDYLQDHRIPKLKRTVMLGPPNHGSHMAELLHDYKIFHYFLGQTGQELTTAKTSIPNSLTKPMQTEVGVIAGNYDLSQGFFTAVPNDGLVTIESAKLAEMKDFIVLPVSHAFMMMKENVITQVVAFLDKGRFIHNA